MSEPVNGNDNPPAHEGVDPSSIAHTEPMDTTADEPRVEIHPQPNTQPEANSQSEVNPRPGGSPPANATASPKPEPNPTVADSQPRPGAQTVREVLNSKINPFVSAGLRQIFRDPENIPDDPLRILGEFLLEKHREVASKGSEAGQAKTDGADS